MRAELATRNDCAFCASATIYIYTIYILYVFVSGSQTVKVIPSINILFLLFEPRLFQ